MDTEGIFRIAASAAKLKLLKVCKITIQQLIVYQRDRLAFYQGVFAPVVVHILVGYWSDLQEELRRDIYLMETYGIISSH